MQTYIEPDTVPCLPMNWCLDEPASAESRMIHLIVLGLLHRSGSTLLQRICNVRPQSLIWGEHGGVLTHFAEIYRVLVNFSITGNEEREQYFASGEDPNLWIANMCPEMAHLTQAIVDAARALLNTLYRQRRQSHDALVGFKEVTYGRVEAELLRRCYPEATMLLLVRHPCDTWNSTPRSWYESLEAWADLWAARAREFADLAKADPRCRLIRYEDLVRQDEKTLQILAETAKVTRGSRRRSWPIRSAAIRPASARSSGRRFSSAVASRWNCWAISSVPAC